MGLYTKPLTTAPENEVSLILGVKELILLLKESWGKKEICLLKAGAVTGSGTPRRKGYPQPGLPRTLRIRVPNRSQSGGGLLAGPSASTPKRCSCLFVLAPGSDAPKPGAAPF